jgi:hypothetical protein
MNSECGRSEYGMDCFMEYPGLLHYPVYVLLNP